MGTPSARARSIALGHERTLAMNSVLGIRKKRLLMATALVFSVAACAAQTVDLAAPSPAMVSAVDEATVRFARRQSTTGQPVTANGAYDVTIGMFADYRKTTQRKVRENFPCTDGAASVLETLGFAPDTIKSVRYDVRQRKDSEGNPKLQGFNAWINFNDQRGYLVVSFRPDCTYETYYTRAGLELPTAT